MKKTNTYKIVKLELHWHLLRLHYKGWWIFRKKVWLTEFPYSIRKEDVVDMLKDRILKCSNTVLAQ